MPLLTRSVIILFLGAVFVASAPLSARAQAAGTAPDTQMGEAPASSALSPADRDFIEEAAQAGHLEAEASQMALRKSPTLDVKTFAQRMVDEHGEIGQELNALASRKGVEAPTEPSLAQKARLKALDVRDESFDKAYADEIAVSAHEEAVKLFDKAAHDDSRDPEIKAFAASVLPRLQRHLEMGKALQQQVASKEKAGAKKP